MLFNSAVYGEVSGGHALRAASGDAEFARSIAGRLDLPSNPPPGVAWSPTVSGFPAEGRYVVARTILDTAAPRANMVLAYTAFAPIEEVQHFGALSSLFRRLAAQADQGLPPVAFKVDEGEALAKPSHLADLASLLVSRSKKPIVNFDCDGFEELISALWLSLWPDMRREFSFRLSFGPEDVYEDVVPAFVWTPKELAARWQGYAVLGHGPAPPKSTAADILAGDADPTDILKFADEIGLTQTGLSAFAQLASAMQLIDASAGVDELAGAIRLIDRLSPSAERGVVAKQVLVHRIARAIPAADGVQILGLRNLLLQGFSEQKTIWKAVSAWMEAQPLHADARLLRLANVIASSQDTQVAIKPWREAIETGGRRLASGQVKKFARAFWFLLGARSDLAAPLLALTPSGSEGESALLAGVPKVLTFELAPLRSGLLSCGWLKLHGAVLAASEAPQEAVRKQLEVDNAEDFLEGLQAALSSARGDEVIAIAMAHDDRRLDAIAGAEVVADYGLLASLDHHLLAVQRIWAAAIERDVGAYRAPSDPVQARNDILTARLNSASVYEPLIPILSTTPLSDLVDFDRRREIWDLGSYADAFLGSTAAGWVLRASAGDVSDLDVRLEQAVLGAAALDEQLRAKEVAGAINLIVALSAIDEGRVVAWFDRVSGPRSAITEQQAERLGHVVLERRWSTLLTLVQDRVEGRPELRATLRICASMLSFWSRWQLGISNVTVEEKWESFTKVAASLYPSGPDEQGVWERSGGENADLPRSSSGLSAWRAALQLVRRGHDPSATRLMAEMLRDFPANSQLHFLAKDKDLNGTPPFHRDGPSLWSWWR